jgi:hypothetical protein
LTVRKLTRPFAALVPFFVPFALMPLAAAPAANAGPAWQPTAPMTTMRTVYAATALLQDGDVFVVGGYGRGNAVLASGDRYDAASGNWTATASMTVGRLEPEATTLADGRVLVTGGESQLGGTLASAELYDPASDMWTAAAAMSAPRTGHSATLLQDGTVLVAGGRDGSTYFASAERYDPASDTWSPVGALPSPHAAHTATRMADGSVVVVGGTDRAWAGPGNEGVSGEVARFDPGSGTWTALAPLPQERAQHATVLQPDGKLLVVGGNSGMGRPWALVRFDAADGAWDAVPGARSFYSPSAVLLRSGLVLINQAAESSTLFDPIGDQFADVGPTPTSRAGGDALLLHDDTVLLVGGSTQEQSADRFVPIASALVAPVDFGEQTTGRRGAVLSVPVVTAGDVPLFPRGTAVEGANAGDFAIVSDGCTGAALAIRQACFVAIRFTPGADGARSASLVLSDGGFAGGRQLVALSGVGVPASSAPAQPAAQPAGGRPAAGRARGSGATRRAPAVPHIRCNARRGRRVVCTGLPRTLGSGKVRLSRAGIVHASGTLSGGRLTLSVRRRLLDRRYTLVVGGRRAVKVVLD